MSTPKTEKRRAPIFATCCRCHGEKVPQDWRPGPGYDPRMRQFKCRRCRRVEYRVITNEDLLTAIDIYVKAVT